MLGRSPLLALGAVFVVVACAEDPNNLTGTRLRRPRGTSASSTSTDDADETDEEELVGAGATAHETCWNTINAYRKRGGLPPLARWSEKEACFDGEAKSDGETNKPHGAFPRCGELAQNECPGTSGPVEEALPKCLAAMMREGPGGAHHDSMMSTKYTRVGCGFFVTSKGIWSVQNFR